MSQINDKKSNLQRARRRRQKRQREASERQKRWHHARLVIESSKSVLYGDEDLRIIGEINSLVYRIDKYLKNTPDDEEIIARAVASGCWVIADICDETGLPAEYVKETLKELVSAGKITREKNTYKPTSKK